MKCHYKHGTYTGCLEKKVHQQKQLLSNDMCLTVITRRNQYLHNILFIRFHFRKISMEQCAEKQVYIKLKKTLFEIKLLNLVYIDGVLLFVYQQSSSLKDDGKSTKKYLKSRGDRGQLLHGLVVTKIIGTCDTTICMTGTLRVHVFR